MKRMCLLVALMAMITSPVIHADVFSDTFATDPFASPARWTQDSSTVEWKSTNFFMIFHDTIGDVGSTISTVDQFVLNTERVGSRIELEFEFLDQGGSWITPLVFQQANGDGLRIDIHKINPGANRWRIDSRFDVIAHNHMDLLSDYVWYRLRVDMYENADQQRSIVSAKIYERDSGTLVGYLVAEDVGANRLTGHQGLTVMGEANNNTVRMDNVSVWTSTITDDDVIFEDQFDGTMIDFSDKWEPLAKTWAKNTRYDCDDCQPYIASDPDTTTYARMEFHTYHPDPAYSGTWFRGAYFQARGPISTTVFPVPTFDKPIRFETRVRITDQLSGQNINWFQYAGSPEGSDEWDYEYLPKQYIINPNTPLVLSTWDEYQGSASGTYQGSQPNLSGVLNPAGQWNIWRADWYVDRMEFWINGVLVATHSTIVPDETMTMKYSLADGGEWNLAYDPNLTPTSNPAEDQVTYFDVDYVTIAFIPELGGDTPYNCNDIWDAGQGLTGDLNQDCVVDGDDYVLFSNGWNNCNDPAGCQ